jgi:RNA polymerase sigma-70 factor (ECF subfamily)
LNFLLVAGAGFEKDSAPMSTDSSADTQGSPRQFVTTRWSLILTSMRDGSDETKAHDALAQLCRIYWRPIYSFICGRGYSISDAQDLTQEFFLMILQGNLLRQADPARGRFRSLLRRSLQNFLADAHAKAHAKKRGGDYRFVSWDEWMAESPSRLTIPASVLQNWPAEKIFDLRWAATVVEQALRRLQEECESRGRRRLFDSLSGLLLAERDEVSYPPLAQELGVSYAEIKRLVHQFRERYRYFLRAEVAETIESPDQIDEELRYLCSALAAGTSA